MRRTAQAEAGHVRPRRRRSFAALPESVSSLDVGLLLRERPFSARNTCYGNAYPCRCARGVRDATRCCCRRARDDRLVGTDLRIYPSKPRSSSRARVGARRQDWRPRGTGPGGCQPSKRPSKWGEGFAYLLLAPFLPSSACAADDLRGLDLPSLLALAFAFLAVALPLPFLSVIVVSTM